MPTRKKLIKFQRYLTKTSIVNRKIDDDIVWLFQLKLISSMRKTQTKKTSAREDDVLNFYSNLIRFKRV